MSTQVSVALRCASFLHELKTPWPFFRAKRLRQKHSNCDHTIKKTINVNIFKCQGPRPESKAVPKPPLATTTPDVKADRVNKEIEVEMGDKMEVDQGAASPAKVVEAAAPSF